MKTHTDIIPHDRVFSHRYKVG